MGHQVERIRKIPNKSQKSGNVEEFGASACTWLRWCAKFKLKKLENWKISKPGLNCIQVF